MSEATYPVETIAKLLMLTPRRVQQLIKDGTIPKGERGRYDLVPAVQGYVKFLRARAIGADTPEGDSNHKTRLLKARADIAEYEAERMAGEVAPVEEIEKTWADMVSRFRQRSLGVAPKAAPMVAVETATEACHEIIETFIHEALAELAATSVDSPAAIAEGDDGGDEDGGTASETEDI
ncbi:MAG: terminase small subunit, Nu1 [Mesorhizobium sp.]|nr:MAG: terminase small subunit, Nu1 [Mesorhizobium sp.]